MLVGHHKSLDPKFEGVSALKHLTKSCKDLSLSHLALTLSGIYLEVPSRTKHSTVPAKSTTWLVGP